MTRRSSSLTLLLLGGALALSTVALFGQASDSILVGTVTDSTGASVVGTVVTATNRETGVKYTSVTSSTGEYRLNNIPVGRYDVSAAMQGFATATVTGVQLQLNHTSSINLTLAVGAMNTSVEVSEAAALLDTSTAQLQSTYDSRAAVDVPSAGISKIVNGAGIYNLSLLGAGVASAGGIGQGTGPSVAGQRPENNTFNIDGVMNDNHYATGPQVYVSNEAVSQFNVVQNQFSAEFGGASGGVFNAVVKTGTNQIHGSIFEYLQNRNLNAVDQQEVQQGIRSNPRFDNNRLGATIGGPIRKDKLFYFGNFEYNPLGQAAQPGQTVFAPTSAGLSALAGVSGVSKVNLGVFQQYVPVAGSATDSVTVGGKSIPIGPLSFASPAYNNSYNAVAAIDWNVSSKDQVRGRYFYNRSIGIDFLAALPVFFEPSPVINNSLSISEFHNFSPSMENELRVSYSRNNQNIGAGDFKFPGLDAFPNIGIDDLQMQIGPDPNTPGGSIENLSQLQENMTKTWGRHTIKAGFNISDIILSGFFVQRVRGDYDYATFEEFLLDKQPTGGNVSGVSGERSAGSSNTPFGYLQTAAYVNDDFRVRRNLTLNLGLRYEYVTVPVGSRAQRLSSIADVPGVITFRSPKSDKNNWAPRLGFAYTPGNSGIWSIRGGVSMSYDNTYINLAQNASPAYYQTTLDVNGNQPVSNFLAHGGLVGAAPGAVTQADARAAIASYTFDQHRPYALNGTIGVQRLIGKDYTIEARYVYTKGVHLWNQTRLNIVSPVTAAHNLPTYLAAPTAAQLAADTLTLDTLRSTPLPGGTADLPFNNLAAYGFGQNLTGYHPWGNSRYNGLAVQVGKRFANNFSYLAAYTWSHNFDDSTATNFSTILSPRRAQDFQNMRAEWASSALDRRHRFTFTPIYDFKPFQKGSWALKNIVGNWNISGTYTFQSPEYATVQSGVDSNLNNDTAGDRAIVNPAGAANTSSGVNPLNAAGQVVAAGSPSIVAYVAKNPNARYIQAGLGARSNGGRNTFPLDSTNNFDAALMKKINFTEGKRLDFGVQAFNLFNHSQFVGGYLSDVSPFTTNAISRNFLVPGNATFGQYSEYFPSNSRQLQIVVRLVF
jgi:Carboxypeptidase regulatory-like domain